MTWSESYSIAWPPYENVDAQHGRVDALVHGSMSAYVTHTSPAVARALDYVRLCYYITSTRYSDSADLLSPRLLSSPTRHSRIGPFQPGRRLCTFLS